MPRVALAAGLLLCGCFPDPTNPRCAADGDCTRLAGGWCRCVDGLCFQFGCTAAPGGDGAADGAAMTDGPASDAPARLPDGAGATETAACAGSEPIAGDGCCPPLLADRSQDADCLLAAGSLGAKVSAVSAPAVADDGRIAVTAVRDGTRKLLMLARSGAELTEARAVPIPSGPDLAAAPVIADGGPVLVGHGGGVDAIPPDGAGATWSTGALGAVAAAPHPLAADRAVVVTAAGHVVELGPGGVVTASPVPLLAGATAEGTALWRELDALVVVAGGALHVIRYTTQQRLDPGPVARGFAGAPALGTDGRVVAVRDTGSGWALGGLRRGATVADWADLEDAAVGPSPLSPVVGESEWVVVASGADRAVAAVRLLGSSVAGSGGATGLLEVPTTPALLGGDGAVYVGLRGWVTALDRDTWAERWRYPVDGNPVGAPAQGPDGGLVVVSASGAVLLLAAGPPAGEEAPWPRWRRDRRSTGAR